MTRATRLFTLLVVVAALALGSVLPAAAQDANPACAGLEAADCQLLLGAQDALRGLQSFTSPEWAIDLNFTDGSQTFAFNASGRGAVVLPQSGTSGLLVHLVIDSASLSAPDQAPQSGSAEVILTDKMAFVNWNGEWYGQELTEDDLNLSELGSLQDMNPASLAGVPGIDLSGTVTTARGADEMILGQNAAAFTTNVDITGFLMAVLSSPVVGQAMGMEGMSDTGMTAEDVQMLGMFLGPMLEGSTLTFTQWVGQDDGLVHQVALDLGLNLNMSAFDPETQPITGSASFRAQIDQINEPYEVAMPENYRSMDELEGQLDSLNLGM